MTKQLFLLSILLFSIFYLLLTTFRWWRADIHFARAQSAAAQAEYNLAFQEYSDAIKLSPYHPVYYSEFGVSLSEMAKYFNSQDEESLAKNFAKKAVEQGRIATILSPNNPIFYNYQALAFHNASFADKKFPSKAINSILISHKLAPNDPKITYYMALYYLDAGNISKALKAFEITAKIKPDYIEAIVNYARLLDEKGQKKKASLILKKLLKYYPGNTNIIKLIKTNTN